MNDILKTTEAAKLLGVQPRVLRGWVKSRNIPFIAYPGNVVRFSRDVLNDWIQFHVINPDDKDTSDRKSITAAQREGRKIFSELGLTELWDSYSPAS